MTNKQITMVAGIYKCEKCGKVYYFTHSLRKCEERIKYEERDGGTFADHLDEIKRD